MNRAILLLPSLVISFVAAADGILPVLPPGEYADTEVATNVALALTADAPRRLRFTVELQASPSNNVEVAVGHDADEDGCLSMDEVSLAVGYDCGEWFVRSAAEDSVSYSAVADSGLFRRTYEIGPRRVDPDWNLVKVTRRGHGVANESVSVELVESGFTVRIQ